MLKKKFARTNPAKAQKLDAQIITIYLFIYDEVNF